MLEVPEDLRAFLEYLNGKVSEHPFIIRLDDEVHKARRNENWRREYMNLLMRDQEKYEQGIEKGRELERANTLKEARRADRAQQEAVEAKREAEAALKEVERLKRLFKENR